MNLILPIFLFFIANQLHTQQWIGYGEGIGIMVFEEDAITAITCNSFLQFEPIKLRQGIQIVGWSDVVTNHFTPTHKLEIFGSQIDSIKILSLNEKPIHTFYSKSHPKKYIFNLKKFEFEIFSYDQELLKSLTLKANRKLIFIDHKKGLREKYKASKYEFIAFLESIRNIEIRSLNECNSQIHITHSPYYRFSFTGEDLNKYTYTTQFLAYNLNQIKNALENIIQE